MSKLSLTAFSGENRAINPRLLPDDVGQTSLNHKTDRGDFRPWLNPLAVATVGAGRKTIYRMGRDVASDTVYWLSWTSVVHVVRGFNSSGAAERTFYTGDGYPKWTDTTIGLGADPPTAFRAMGLPAPVAGPSLSVAGGVSTDPVETRSYVYTYVNDVGFESAPSPATEITCKPDDTVTITGFSAAPSGAYNINRLRIYRTEATSTGVGASFFFLKEVPSSTTTTDDTNTTLGEVLPSTTWLPAPGIPQGGPNNLTEPALTCLIGLWNGMMAGISDRGVRFCEAYIPYAWPIAYDVQPADYSPVALGTYSQVLVCLTNGNPIAITGASPDAMDMAPIDFLQACVSVRSVVSMGTGVYWASPDGLAYVGAGGPRVVTEGIMTREDWQAINPTSIIGCGFNGKYFGFFTVAGVQQGFVFDPSSPKGLFFLDSGADAAYTDDLQDAMYILRGTSVQKWDAGATSMTAVFKTKRFESPKPICAFAVANVLAEGYPVTFKLYADNVLKLTKTVTNQEPFRLPSGYHAYNHVIEISTQYPLLNVAIAHTMKELSEG